MVIPTKGRTQLLERCLVALEHQTMPRDRFEVIVVHDVSADDGTQPPDGRPGPSLNWLPTHSLMSHRPGPAAARNVGWRSARADVVAFTDDDCVPDPSWLEAGLSALQDGLACVGGRMVVPLPHDPTDYERDVARLEEAEFVTANCFCRRTVLEQVGGFDERFQAAWREDTDLYWRVIEAGLSPGHVGDAVVLHPVRAAGWGISIRQQRKSYYNALLFRKHPRLYRERIQPAPPWSYYLTVLAAVATGLRTMRREPFGPLLLLSPWLWLALYLRFCGRRLRYTSHRRAHVVEMFVTSAFIPFLAVYWRLRGAVAFRVWFL